MLSHRKGVASKCVRTEPAPPEGAEHPSPRWRPPRVRTTVKPMKIEAYQSWSRVAGVFVVATVLSSILFAQSEGRAVRGEPIRVGGAPKGAPIKPLAPVTTTPTAAPAVSTEIAVAKVGDYQPVGFDKLAGFAYVVPEYAGTNKPILPDTNQIPASVKAFNGQAVALKGFMLPLKVEAGKVTEMLLMRDQSLCCFGSVPKINEFVTVKMVGGGTKAVMDQAVTLYGRLKVGEFMENGFLLGIYQLEGDKAGGPGL